MLASGRSVSSLRTASSAPRKLRRHHKSRCKCTGARIAVLVPRSSPSPYKSAEWSEVFDLMTLRMRWENEKFELKVHLLENLADASHRAAFEADCSSADVFIGVDVHASEKSDLHNIIKETCSFSRPVSMMLDSAPVYEKMSRIQGLPVAALPPLLLNVISKLPGGWGKASKTWPILKDMWYRRSSDDLAFLIALAINDFVTPVPSTQVNMGGDLNSLVCMCTKCQKEITACVQDPNCKAALDALAACNLNDQVCSYQVIASYESDLLEDFSLCILQKHNCLGNHAEIPNTPDPIPLASFQGKPMTHDIAEDILVGHLAPRIGGSSSWRVVCGKNAAYDKFPCQYQLYYRAKGKGMWYDPVFKVNKLGGGDVWRRRHYRVQRGKVPGTFNYSVLDNGVTSKEFWRVMDCADDLSWAVFYYSGAASTAGITYRGALLCTPSGLWPEPPEAKQRIGLALAACSIRMWEMSEVENCSEICGDAPLVVPDDANIVPVSVLAGGKVQA